MQLLTKLHFENFTSVAKIWLGAAMRGSMDGLSFAIRLPKSV